MEVKVDVVDVLRMLPQPAYRVAKGMRTDFANEIGAVVKAPLALGGWLRLLLADLDERVWHSVHESGGLPRQRLDCV